MIRFVFALSLVATPLLARAEDAPAFTGPTETLVFGPAKGGKFLEAANSIGGYGFFTFGYSTSSGSSVFGIGGGKTKQKIDFRFTDPQGAVLLAGQCRNDAKEKVYFGLTLDKNSGLYTCNINDVQASDYALQVQLPNAVPGISIGPMTTSNPDAWKGVKARMIYKGATYEALATGPDDVNPFHPKLAKGYSITRDGRTVGLAEARHGGPNGPRAVIAPTAPGDEREAVIFFAAQLLAMPNPN